MKSLFQFADAVQSEMKDRSRKRGVCISFAEHFDEMLRIACAAGGYDRDLHGARYFASECAVES
jgi:hypothetical protein